MKLLEYAERALEWVVELLLALMAIVVFINVIARYLFAKAFPWTEEIAIFMFTWIIFLGALLAFKRHRHLGVDLLLNVLPPLPRKIVALLGNILVGGALLVLIDGGVKYYFQTIVWPAPATQIPYGVINAIIPFAAFFMLLLLLKDIISLLRGENDKPKGEKQC
ncbi:Tripartite ATP-independent periplasmic transporter, DctQ component [Thermosinus carboxydivorans Nor1]|uniref:Tripartite ATP-independent periplasmic transporter, DctQ component n=1 Tax=Thermosinus carboxydivorans Nor1 TaxID=401526 RepID=A1HSQ3_9FIRM|nr:TRAP transporter small permease [Thermosinus carboxydivorans]EAX46934.1 Tripartite ATP-independent periplasmic transporter, DctQ component [Thermosinus carboxydivorans Nor1]